jgi:hypothetical protein
MHTNLLNSAVIDDSFEEFECCQVPSHNYSFKCNNSDRMDNHNHIQGSKRMIIHIQIKA